MDDARHMPRHSNRHGARHSDKQGIVMDSDQVLSWSFPSACHINAKAMATELPRHLTRYLSMHLPRHGQDATHTLLRY